MKRLLILPLLFFFLPLSGRGQGESASTLGSDPPRTRFGAYGDLNLNLHSAGFTALPGVPNCCPEYRMGFGFGPTLGLLFETPLSSQFLLSLRGGYSVSGATLARDEETTVEQDGRAVPMTIEHTIAARLGDIGLEPLVAWRVNERMTLMGGTRIGYVIASDFAQQEKISDETLRGTFENGRRTRHEFSGEIPGAFPVQASIMGGVGYELPLNADGTLLATPELLFSLGVTPVSSDVSWHAHALRGGIALKYSPKQFVPPPPFPPDPPVVPVPPAAPPVLAARVTAAGLDPDGTEHPSVRLQVEEFIATETYPLLNYVFFDENSSALPDRYAKLNPEETDGFTTTALQGEGALRIYRQVLNIVGGRMRANPNAVLRLVGSNANIGVEEGKIELSRSRAETVRNYLRDVWGVAESRMRIDRRNLPEAPSNPESVDGQSENRRVEMYLSGGERLAPVVIEDTIRRATPPSIRFRPEVRAEAGIAAWEITAVQDGRELKRLSGSGELPPVVEWRVDQESETMPHAPGRLFYTLSVTDLKGGTYTTAPEAIDVEQITLQKKRDDRLADVEIKRYSLILFGYDDARLGEEHRGMLAGIGKEIAPDAEIIIRGYADRSGEDERNRKLAQERAEAVAKGLGAPGDHVRVEGSTEPLYDNDIPEGRFYSRTVTVEIRTPIVDGDSG